MKIDIRAQGGALLVKLSGEIDHHSASEIRKTVDSKIMNGNLVDVVFDFSEVSFMDSSGIGVIMGRYRIISSLGGRIKIISPKPHIKRILAMSGIKEIVDL